MKALLLRLETFESRMIPRSSPLGTSGRVTAIRLTRCFQLGRPSRTTELHQNLVDKTAANQTQYHHAEHNPQSESAVTTSQLAEGFANELRHVVHTGWRDFRETREVWRACLVDAPPRIPATALGDALAINFPTNAANVEQNTAQLYRAMRMQNPHAILSALIRLVGLDRGSIVNAEALSSISSTTFYEILFFLEPKHFVGRYSELHYEISRQTAHLLGLPPTTYYQFHTTFLYHIRGIFAARNKTHSQSMADYKYMLKCARATGDTALAEYAWKLMHTKGILPDLDCFNHHLATICWSDRLKPNQRFNLRVIPRNLSLRTWSHPSHRYSGHRIGDSGIKKQVTLLFRRMVKAGIECNEETFCLLITALAREGDLPGIGTILKSVWGIDVDAINTSSGTGSRGIKKYTTDSPFYPSSRLLFTISHVYGINNAIPTALQVVDLISRQYSIVIPRKIWWELLQWTYVLSANPRARKRSNPELKTQTGQLPHAAVYNLWTTMISEPYEIQPSMAMYDLVVRSLISSQNYTKVRALMESGRELHKQGVREFGKARLRLADSVRSGHLAEISSLTRDLQFFRLRMKRDRLYIRGWVRLLLKSMQSNLRHHADFAHRDLPGILRNWELFAPRRLEIRLLGLQVRFKTSSQRRNRVRQQQYALRDTINPRTRDAIPLLNGRMPGRQRRAFQSRWEARQIRRSKRQDLQMLAQEEAATEQISLID
ncbi:hypothetical protein BP6252_00703 [Coleophoma cylindrospora]|uniref:Pentatricopeptide repeat-containing protein n=1 Tax=Coleophoma cylindrospora TaxID=1849047 RepID=A0A3D8SR71_9HELO|nr:hypothetical protein BP6252_00703 [Coleophoma cylindrospora]